MSMNTNTELDGTDMILNDWRRKQLFFPHFLHEILGEGGIGF